MSNLIVLKTSIRDLDGLYSLNDLHKASGNDPKHRPNQFVRLDVTQDLINEIQGENSTAQICALRSINGGANRGTYACEELILNYAMWISPKFHLIVLRAFLAMQRNQPQQLALPEPEKKFTVEFTEYELQQLTWLWFAFKRGVGTFQHIEKAFRVLGSNMSGQIDAARDNLSLISAINQIKYFYTY